MKTLLIDAGRSDTCYLIDTKACRVVSQLYSNEPLSVRKMLEIECLLNNAQNIENLFVLHNNHIYDAWNMLIF